MIPSSQFTSSPQKDESPDARLGLEDVQKVAATTNIRPKKLQGRVQRSGTVMPNAQLSVKIKKLIDEQGVSALERNMEAQKVEEEDSEVKEEESELISHSFTTSKSNSPTKLPQLHEKQNNLQSRNIGAWLSPTMSTIRSQKSQKSLHQPVEASQPQTIN